MMNRSKVIRTLFSGFLATGMAYSMSASAVFRDMQGAICVPADAGWSNITYTTSGAIKNNSTTANRTVICPHFDGGFRTSYSASLAFESGSQFNGGTTCVLRAAGNQTHNPSVIVSSSGTWTGGNSLLSLSVAVPNGSVISTGANVRCALPISSANGVPGVSGIRTSSLP